DFIKLNLIEADRNNSEFLKPTGFAHELVYKFLDRTQQNLVSFYGKADYSFKDHYALSLLLRTDGSSNAPPTRRSLFSPALSCPGGVRSRLMQEAGQPSAFSVRSGAPRLGRIYACGNVSRGPLSTPDLT